MIESSPSRTALATSLMRALHARRDPSPLLDDPWGDRLVPQSEREGFGQRILARMDSDARAAALRAPGSILDDFLLTNVSYPGVVIRSRYAEDALKEATNRGTRQYVLIGAGFDSFALRRPAFSETLEIFEIDHPATQTFKISAHQGLRYFAPSVGTFRLCRPRERRSCSRSGAKFVSKGRAGILLVAWRHGVPYARGQSGHTARGRERQRSGKRTRFHLCRSRRVRPGSIAVARRRQRQSRGDGGRALFIRVRSQADRERSDEHRPRVDRRSRWTENVRALQKNRGKWPAPPCQPAHRTRPCSLFLM